MKQHKHRRPLGVWPCSSRGPAAADHGFQAAVRGVGLTVEPVGQRRQFEFPDALSFLNPAMALFGIDPAAAGSNYLLVDNKGLAEGGRGSSTGNRGTIIRTPKSN